VNDILQMEPDASKSRKIEMSYGGLLVECFLNPDRLFNVTLDALIGGGNIRLEGTPGLDSVRDDFFVIEPGANIDLNLAKYAKLEVGVSYRLAGGLTTTRFSDSGISGFNGTMTLKLGVF
jgi:hypothetical protein